NVLLPAAAGLPAAIPSPSFRQDFTMSQVEAATCPHKPGAYEPAFSVDPSMQPGGETVAWRYLRSFTEDRADGYSRQIGNPSLGRRSSSRLSTYLAWGCHSMRQVYQWTKTARVSRPVSGELRRFRERLWWRAHYYQKLEAEWQIETQPLNPAFVNLHRTRVRAQKPPLTSNDTTDVFHRFITGTTGFPMIDASVRCLDATGWLNFRMRAMLVTFSTFVLWLDWRPVAQWLSSRFLDYDPGIHYGQLQMQAGLTGYHVPRNYNPYKQGEEKDPEGNFVHRWVPELQNIPAPWCHYPHRMTPLEQQLYGFDATVYPAPMVDYTAASRDNMDRYWAVRNSDAAQQALPAIWAKHCLPEAMEQYLRGENATPRREP
ncbi:MAG: FAD-binding domain-containing protein, partial [Bacteroidota bacterium]